MSEIRKPEHYIETAMRETLGAMVLPGVDQDAYVSAFLSTLYDWPQRHLQTSIDHLGTVAWEWPELEQWQRFFALTGEEPYMWRTYREEWQDRRHPGSPFIGVIAHTIYAKGLSQYGMAKLNRSREQDWRHKIGKGDGYYMKLSIIQDSDANLTILRDLQAEWDSGDCSRIPPIFPGDRSSFITMNRHWRRRT